MTSSPISVLALSERDVYFQRFEKFVSDASFPCVGAKSALNRGRLSFDLYDQLTDPAAVSHLCGRLEAFSRSYENPGLDPVSYVAMFRRPVANEPAFHAALWSHLQAMHDHDSQRYPWDDAVSDDVGDAQFSFSIAARAFFVVGLHPHASRLARRVPFPCLVFNFHDQFEALRHEGRYDRLQDAIRVRDIALQGHTNPTLARFGDGSEADQYSGRPVAIPGRCPFAARAA